VIWFVDAPDVVVARFSTVRHGITDAHDVTNGVARTSEGSRHASLP
jgi:hypothetical protein